MRLLYLLFILLFTSCGIGFQYTTLNHAGHIDGIYSSKNYTVDTLNEFQVRNKLRTDFNFRYDFAQYALSQPASFDWNNRLLGNRYNFYNPYWGYNYSWNRDIMWHDWVWGYPYSNWGWNSWNRPYWGYNNYYGWNGYNNWYNGPWHNSGYNVVWNSSRNNNVAYINGRRGSSNVINRSIENRIIKNYNRPRINTNQNSIDEIVINLRDKINNKPVRIYNNPNNIPNNNSTPRINNPVPRINNNSRPSTTIRTTPSRPIRSSNNNTVRINSRRKN